MPPRKQLDLAALQALAEPFTVRVERVNGTSREPIPLPDQPNADYTIEDPPPCSTVATGWTVDQVRALESWILGWTGGGNYSVSITDANNQPFEWSFNYSIRDHKMKAAPTATPVQQAPNNGMGGLIAPPASAIAHAVSQGIPVPGVNVPMQPQPQPLMVQNTMQNEAIPMGGLPSASSYTQIPVGQPQAPQAPYVYQLPMYPQTPRLPSNATPDQRTEAENRMMREQLTAAQNALAQQAAQAQINNATMQHREELRQAEARHEKEMAALRDQMNMLARPKETDIVHAVTSVVEGAFNKLADVLKPKDDSETKLQRMIADMERKHEEQLRQLREDQARKDTEAQRERDRLEAQRREDQIRAEMRDNAARMEKMIEQLAAANAAKPAGPDPMLMFMQQFMQSQADAMKSIAQQQSLSTQQLAQFMMPPAQMLAMLKDAGNSSDNLIRGIDSAYANVMTMMQTAMQTVMGMQPQGGSPVVEAVQTIAEKAGKIADRWVGAQEQAIVQNAKTQQTVVNAQADVAKAQIAAQTGGQPQLAPPQPGSIPSTLPTPADIAAAQPSAPMAAPAPNNVVPITGPKRHGRTDEEWFGPALPNVNELREGARILCESLETDPWRRDAKGVIVGLTPGMAARGLQSAAAHILSNKLDIPAFSKLYMNDQYADLMDILLPPEFGVTQVYRDLVVKFLTKQIPLDADAGMFSREAEEDDEEDEEEPSEEEMRETDGAATPKKRSSTSGGPRPASA